MFPIYDGNGNITRLYDSSSVPAMMAAYKYGPFGEDRGRQGPIEASRFPLRWSTKYCDEEAGLSYYGRRYYSSSLGRWLSLDRTEERGGLNLVGFADNNPISRIDSIGDAPRLSKTTVMGPTWEPCGGFEWTIRWELDAPAMVPNPIAWGGWIIQHVTETDEIKDCQNRGANPGPNKRNFWEAWPVQPGQQRTAFHTLSPHDDDYVESPHPGTKGKIEIKATATYYDGLVLPPVFRQIQGSISGILPISEVDPKLTGGSNIVHHNLTATWNCCCARGNEARGATKIDWE
jgi:RHS repeat-associated protein